MPPPSPNITTFSYSRLASVTSHYHHLHLSAPSPSPLFMTTISSNQHHLPSCPFSIITITTSCYSLLANQQPQHPLHQPASSSPSSLHRSCCCCLVQNFSCLWLMLLLLNLMLLLLGRRLISLEFRTEASICHPYLILLVLFSFSSVNHHPH